jgi:hypothetical protein
MSLYTIMVCTHFIHPVFCCEFQHGSA